MTGSLVLDGVTRRFGATTALDSLTLTIGEGELVALLGPSGSGKSTALACIAGLQPVSAGSITLDGRSLTGVPPDERDVGMVFQNYALFPHLTVRQNVAFGLEMRHVRRDEIARRVGEMLDLVRMSAHADAKPRELSGGEQQRVAIARAVVTRPRLVLMDEPLSNLDATLRVDLRTEIKRLHSELGLTTVYVTHDQTEALSLADRLVVLNKGRTQQIGTPEELYRRPASAFVAQFMGYRNLLSMRIAGGRTGQAARATADGFELDGTLAADAGVGVATVAVRPADLRVTTAADGIAARIVTCEYEGERYAVTATAGDQTLYAESSHPVSPGDPVRLVAPADRVLVFPADQPEALAS